MLLNSPLEQFQILPIIKIFLGIFDFSLTNSSLIVFFSLILLYAIFSLNENFDKTFYFIPTRIYIFFEEIYFLIYFLLLDNVGKESKGFFPYIFTLFIFVLICNVIGLVPYSFTMTSHLIVTFSLALISFIGINFICCKKHGFKIFSLFFPVGSSFYLGLLLVPIEIISFIFRPISLSVRLFANMMAGHTLLKVIVGFAWIMMLAGGSLFFLHFIPLFLLLLLMLLELGVALIQSYVFTILTCLYLNDAINLH